jgi:hypothetical protein
MRRCASISWDSHPIPDFRFRQLQFSPTPIQSANPSFPLHFLSAPSFTALLLISISPMSSCVKVFHLGALQRLNGRPQLHRGLAQ